MKKRVALLLLTFVLLVGLAVPAFAQEQTYVYDEAQLLTASETRDLEQKFGEVYRQYGFGVYVVTVDDHYGDMEDFAQELFNELCGSGNDGIILVLSMAGRDYHLWTDGKLNTEISNSEMDAIEDAVTSALFKDRFYDAFTALADESVDAMVNAFDWGMNLLIAAGVGLIVALIVVLVLRSQLKSVSKQFAAQNYVKPGSMNITRAHEFYLYRTVNRVRRADTSSAGRSSGGNHSRGGKF